MIDVSMDHRLVNDAAWIERSPVPPRQSFNAHDLGAWSNCFDPGSRITEHCRARVNGLPIMSNVATRGEKAHGSRPHENLRGPFHHEMALARFAAFLPG